MSLRQRQVRYCQNILGTMFGSGCGVATEQAPGAQATGQLPGQARQPGGGAGHLQLPCRPATSACNTEVTVVVAF